MTDYKDYYGGTAKSGSWYDKKMQEYGAKLKPKQTTNQKNAMKKIMNSVSSGAKDVAKKYSILNSAVKFGKALQGKKF